MPKKGSRTRITGADTAISAPPSHQRRSRKVTVLPHCHLDAHAIKLLRVLAAHQGDKPESRIPVRDLARLAGVPGCSLGAALGALETAGYVVATVGADNLRYTLLPGHERLLAAAGGAK